MRTNLPIVFNFLKYSIRKISFFVSHFSCPISSSLSIFNQQLNSKVLVFINYLNKNEKVALR